MNYKIIENLFNNIFQLVNDNRIIVITIWIVIMPKSNLIWRVFRSLPPPPKILKQALGRES